MSPVEREDPEMPSSASRKRAPCRRPALDPDVPLPRRGPSDDSEHVVVWDYRPRSFRRRRWSAQLLAWGSHTHRLGGNMGWLKAVEPGDQAQADFAKAWRTVASSSLTRHDDLAKSLEKAGVDGQIGVQTATHLVTQASTRSFQRHLAAEGPTLAVEKAQAAAAQTSTTPAPGAAGDSMVLKLSRPSMLSADVRLEGRRPVPRAGLPRGSGPLPPGHVHDRSQRCVGGPRCGHAERSRHRRRARHGVRVGRHRGQARVRVAKLRP
jgi:hypothetical protein